MLIFGLGAPVVLGLAWLLLLRFFAKTIVYASIIASARIRGSTLRHLPDRMLKPSHDRGLAFTLTLTHRQCSHSRLHPADQTTP